MLVAILTHPVFCRHLVRPCQIRRQAIKRCRRWPCRAQVSERHALLCAKPFEPSRLTLQEPEDPKSDGSLPDLAPERQGGPASTSAAGLQLPRETVTKLRSTLSHPSEFWVTSVENYEANGVLFKGNLRAKDVQKAYASTASRLKVCLLLHAVCDHCHMYRSASRCKVDCFCRAVCFECSPHHTTEKQQVLCQPGALARLWHPADGRCAVYGSCTAGSPAMRRLHDQKINNHVRAACWKIQGEQTKMQWPHLLPPVIQHLAWECTSHFHHQGCTRMSQNRHAIL